MMDIARSIRPCLNKDYRMVSCSWHIRICQNRAVSDFVDVVVLGHDRDPAWLMCSGLEELGVFSSSKERSNR
jgi:hypothetical protein